ncbi:MAG: hypothetical protein ACFFDH_21055 [Promethearchaeota archaeon]
MRIKEIPNEDFLFRNFNLKLLTITRGYSIDEVPINAFRDVKGDGISTGWNKYCSAKKLRRLAKERKFNGVIKSNVGDIRKIIPLNVRHNPTMVNYGHSLIIGLPKKRDEKLKIRSLLKDISEWVIPINMDFI